jgi:hypothetical protein
VPQLPGLNGNGTYLAHVTVGAVGAAAGFGQEPTFPLGGVGTVLTPATRGGADNGAVAGAPGSLASQLGGGANTVAGAPPPQVAAPQATGLRGVLDGLTSGQVETLYAVVALGGMLLFIGWRGTVLLRPGPPGTRRRR